MLCQFYSGTVFLYICVYVTVLFIKEEEEEEEEEEKKKKTNSKKVRRRTERRRRQQRGGKFQRAAIMFYTCTRITCRNALRAR